MAATLRLVETAEIVNLEENRFLDGWALLPDSMKKRSESRAKCRKLWDDHARRCGGQEALLGALRAYLKGDKDLPKSGGPGLQVWLRAERYDHWLVDPDEPTRLSNRQTFPEPMRGKILSSTGSEWVVSYLDPSILHEDQFITPATEFARKKLLEKASVLKAAGVAGLRKKE